MLQHLADGRVDLMLGRGNTGPVYPWFGQDIRNGIPLAVENYALLRRLWREDVVDWEGQFRTPLQGFTVDPAPARRRAAVRLARLDPQPGDRRAGRVLRRRLLPQQHLLADEHVQRMVALYRRRFEHYGHGPADQAIVGLGGQVFMRANSQDAVREFRPYFDNAPVYGHGPSLEDFTDQTPLTVGSPQQVIDRTLGFRDVRRRLPAPAVPDRPRRPAAEDGARAAGHPRRAGRAGAAPGVRGAASPAHVPDAPDARRACCAAAAPDDETQEVGRMTSRTLAVVSAGLSTPSSTRLLADRLRRRDRGGPARARGVDVEVDVVELREHAPRPRRPRCSPASRPAAAAGGARHGPRRGRADRRHAGVHRVLQRAVQVVLRRARPGRRWPGKPVLLGATGGTARHSLALEYALRPLFAYLRAAVVPTAVFAASEDWGRRPTARWTGGSTGRPASWPSWSPARRGAGGRPVRRPDPVRAAAPRRLTRGQVREAVCSARSRRRTSSSISSSVLVSGGATSTASRNPPVAG